MSLVKIWYVFNFGCKCKCQHKQQNALSVIFVLQKWWAAIMGNQRAVNEVKGQSALAWIGGHVVGRLNLNVSLPCQCAPSPSLRRTYQDPTRPSPSKKHLPRQPRTPTNPTLRSTYPDKETPSVWLMDSTWRRTLLSHGSLTKFRIFSSSALGCSTSCSYRTCRHLSLPTDSHWASIACKDRFQSRRQPSWDFVSKPPIPTWRVMSEWQVARPSRIMSKKRELGRALLIVVIPLAVKGSLLHNLGAKSPCLPTTDTRYAPNASDKMASVMCASASRDISRVEFTIAVCIPTIRGTILVSSPHRTSGWASSKTRINVVPLRGDSSHPDHW